MEKSVLEKNLEAISRYNPILADKIAKHTQVEATFEFLEAKTGDIILSYNKISLHDTTDPQDEALKIFNKLFHDNKTINPGTKSAIHVLFGIGLGYLFKRFSLNCAGKIVVFEPNPDILRITLEVVDFSEELNKDNIAIVDSKEGIERCFDKFFFVEAEITLSFLTSYDQLYPEKINELASELHFFKGLYTSSYKNLMEKASRWTISGMGNIAEMMSNYELESLRQKFNNKPAVIISAGPSLDKNIDLLSEYKGKVLTFCVGTALKAAVKHGIKPDFLNILEHNDCSGQVNGVDTSDMNLILHPGTHNKFYNLPTKRKFNYYPNNDFTTKWLADYLDFPLEDYLNKGTVSFFALFCAKILGCNPIILIGQDLAYTNGNCYSKDSAYGDVKCLMNSETGVFEVSPEDMDSYLANNIINLTEEKKGYVNHRFNELTQNLYFVKGQNGEMLPTDPGYATFIKYFEDVASEFGNEIKLINATEGGAYLEGFEHSTLKCVLEKYATEEINAENIINEALNNAKALLENKGQAVLKGLDETIKLIEKSRTYTENGLKSIIKFKEEFDKGKHHTTLSKRYCEEALKSYLELEKNFINKNTLFQGMILECYFRFSHYMIDNKNIVDENSVNLFSHFGHAFFKDGGAALEESLHVLKDTRKKLYESCNSACEKSVC